MNGYNAYEVKKMIVRRFVNDVEVTAEELHAMNYTNPTLELLFTYAVRRAREENEAKNFSTCESQEKIS
jgi:hypothetical protein